MVFISSTAVSLYLSLAVLAGVLLALCLPFYILITCIPTIFLQLEPPAMLSSASKHQSEYHNKTSLQNSVQIDTLYRQFQSLKSQIYGGKPQSIIRGKQTKWNDKQNASKAKELLRESTIKKYQREFAENMGKIERKAMKEPLRRSSKSYMEDQELADEQEDQMEFVFQNRNFSKKLSKYVPEQSPSISYNQQAEDADQFEEKDELLFSHGQQIFRQFLNKSSHQPLLSSSMKKTKAPVLEVSQLQKQIEVLTNSHLDKLSYLLQNIVFMTRKLHCLEMIVEQYGKIMRVKRDSSLQKAKTEQFIIFDIKRIENQYDEQIKDLVRFYEDKMKQTERSYRQTLKQSIRESELAITHRFEEETNKMKGLLIQAKELIGTKEELIISLYEENNELRDEIERLKKMNNIKGSKGSMESSLRYSATKYPETLEKEVQQTKKMPEIVESISPNKGEEWSEFQNQSNDQINYSELQSVRDKSMEEEWDISQLDIKQTNSNAKSVEGDCLDFLTKQAEASPRLKAFDTDD